MQRNPDNNIIRVSRAELDKLGYKPLEITKDKKGNVIPAPAGSLLALLKDENLWAELDKHAKVTPDKHLILIK